MPHKVDEQRRRGRGIDQERKGPPQERVFEAPPELLHGRRHPLEARDERAQRLVSTRPRAEHHLAEEVVTDERPAAPDVGLDRRGVARRQLLEVALEPVEVVVVPEEPPVRGQDASAFLELDHVARHGPELEPHVIDLRAGRAAEQVMDAAVERVTLAFPRAALPAGHAVGLEDPGLEAVHPAVDARGEPAHAGADDDDRTCHDRLQPKRDDKSIAQPRDLPP